MPRTLLLPIPHEIADSIHITLQTASETWMELAVKERSHQALHLSKEFAKLAAALDTLARESGVIGW